MKKILLLFLALLSVGGAFADKTVYLNPTATFDGDKHWSDANAVFAAWVWEDGQNGRWVTPTSRLKKDGVTYYKFVVNDNEGNILFHRADSYENAKSWDNDEDKTHNPWNSTGNLTLGGDNILFTITGWGSAESSTFTPYASSTYKTIYLCPGLWDAADATEAYAAYAYNNDNNNDWFAFTPLSGYIGLYTAQVPSDYSNLILTRGQEGVFYVNPDGSWNVWNQVEGINFTQISDNTQFSITDWAAYFAMPGMNLAQGATVSWGTDDNHTERINGDGVALSYITDGNDNTNVQALLSSEEPVLSVVLDLGSAKTFNTLLLNQTGDRWNTAFQLYVSSDNSTWTEVDTKSTSITSGRFVTTFSQQTAQYVKYVSNRTSKNVQDDWGAGLAEIQLYNLTTLPTVQSIELNSSATKTIPGDNIILTAAGISNLANVKIGLGAITWNISTNTANATISDGVYTAANAGTSVISATADGVTSNEVTITTIEVPTPTEPNFSSSMVLGLNSAKYGTLAGLAYYDWGGNSTSVTTITIGDREVRKVNNFGTLGQASFAVQDISEKNECHISIFPVCDGTVDVDIHPIYNEGNEKDKENFITLTGNQWNYVSFNIKDVADADYTTLGQFKLSKRDAGNNKMTILFADLYFANPVLDKTAPDAPTVSSVTPAATTATLTVSATDNIAGNLTYNVKKGDEIVGSGVGASGADASVTISGLTAETTYAAGTFTVTATDAAGNESEAAAVPVFTTTVKPMSADYSTTVYNSSAEGVNGKVINYTCTFTQTGKDVTVTFNYTIPEDIPGLVQYDVTATGGEKDGTHSYKWTGCSDGVLLHAHSSWAAASGGLAETKEFYYTVTGDNAGLMKLPADENGINEILGTGAITAAAFKALTTAEEKAYDLRNLKVESAVALEANNANAVFIVKEDQKTNLSGTNNLLVKNGNQYEGAITIVDQFNANYFATNLPIYATTASYTRAGVAADDYVTIALPFDADVPEGFSIYTAGEADGDNNVTFTKKESQTFEASQPYVIHNTNDENTDLVVNATVNALLNFTETTQGAMHSVFSLKTTDSSTENMYVLWGEDESEKGKIVFHAAKGVSLGAFRAYFTGNADSPAPLLGMVDDNGTTGINSVERRALSVEGCYTLDGRRVAQPTKGLYIVNGKKVVIK